MSVCVCVCMVLYVARKWDAGVEKKKSRAKDRY